MYVSMYVSICMCSYVCIHMYVYACNVLLVKIEGPGAGIPSIIIYLLLNGFVQPPLLINQPMGKKRTSMELPRVPVDDAQPSIETPSACAMPLAMAGLNRCRSWQFQKGYQWISNGLLVYIHIYRLINSD